MRTWLTTPAPRKHEGGILSAMAVASMLGMAEVSSGAKEEMRDEVWAAGLGHRLAGTVRSKVFPSGGRPSMAPGGIVYIQPGKPGGRSAPAILGHYERGTPITPAFGSSLAIPTDEVPMTGRGNRYPMTVVEVEAFFGRKLLRRRLRTGNMGLFLSLRRGKGTKLVLMFTIVRNVPGRKALDFGGIVRRWGGRFGELTAANFNYRG